MVFRNLRKKIETWVRRGRQAPARAPPNASSVPLGATHSSALYQSVPQPNATVSSEQSASKFYPVAPKTSQLSSLQERLWDEAYNDLRKSEPGVVEAFEEIIAIKLDRNGQDVQLGRAVQHGQSSLSKPTPLEMQNLVYDGLDRTAKAASVKQSVGNALQLFKTAKGMMDSAVQFAPQAAIPWAGVCLALEVLSNPITEDRDNREGITYVLSRIQWYWELSSLLLDENVKREKQSFEGLRHLLEEDIKRVFEKLLSYQLRSICLYHRHQIKAIFKDAFKVDGWANQLRAIKEAEAAVWRDIKQYSTENIRNKLETLTKSTDKNLKEVISIIQDQTRQQERRYQDEQDKQCLHDLYITDPSTDKKCIEETKGGLLEGSYSWILKHDDFIQFRNSPQSRLLWIKGDPGKGKTMLLCGIIGQLGKSQTEGRVLSYFFCQANDKRINTATSVLRGLIFMLLDQDASLVSHLRKKHDTAGKALFEDANAWHALTDILIGILQDPKLQEVCLVVDALDECVQGLPQLLDLIVQTSRFPRTKWLVSSRNWVEIQEKLCDMAHRLSLELNAKSVSAAVKSYIEFKVSELTQMKGYQESTADEVRRYLRANANDTFLWVSLVCQKLRKVPPRHAQDALKSFPPGLNSLYGRMMEYISSSDDAEACREILALVSTAYRPVSVDELQGLTRSIEKLSQEEVLEVIAACGSFLTLRDSIIFFVHQSAKDFLLDKASDKILSSGIKHQHFKIFKDSLDLLGTLKRDIYDLRNPGYPIGNVEKPSVDPLASIRYSCTYWVDHLQAAGVVTRTAMYKESVVTNTLKFLKTDYLHWLEALSLIHSIPEGVKAMHKLKLLAKDLSEELQSLVEDAFRFLLSHSAGIEIAPLQCYASALVFSPTGSLIRKTFENEEPDWITLKPRIRPEWDTCMQTLEGHSDCVRSVVSSADGQRLASGSQDKTIKIWDAATGLCLQTLEGHGDWVRSVVFSADGQRLASGSHDKTIKIWDAVTGSYQQTLKGHDNHVHSVVFSSDGQRLVSGSHDKTIKIRDAVTGARPRTLKGHGDYVKSVVFSSDGQRLASGSSDETIKIWDAATGACLQTLEGHSDWVISVVFSVDGQRLASGSDDKTIKIWDAATGACLQTLEGHSNHVNSVVFSADGQRLASGSSDETIKIWDAATGACLQTLEGHSDWVRSVVFSADGQRLASGSDDKTIKIWDAATGACLQTHEGHDNYVNSVVFSADGQRLVSGSSDETVKIWDANTGAYQQMLEGNSTINSVVFSADGQRLVSGSNDKTVKIWDAATGACLQTLEGHDNYVNSVVFSADGQRLASGANDKTVKIWDAVTGACLQTLEGHNDWVISVVFSVDGQRLVSGSDDKTIKIWDAATGACLQTHEGHSNHVNSVIFSADGQRLASGSSDKTIKIWDAVTGACLQTLEGHSDWVRSVVFSADGRRLASGSDDKTIKIWDATTGACLQTVNVGRVVCYLSFDITINPLLSTDTGLLDLIHPALPPTIDDQSTEETLRAVSHPIWGISADGKWIVKDGKEMLWLHPKYHRREPAIVGSTVAIGCGSGCVLVMRFY